MFAALVLCQDSLLPLNISAGAMRSTETGVLKSQPRNVKPQLLQLSFDVEQRSIRNRQRAH